MRYRVSNLSANLDERLRSRSVPPLTNEAGDNLDGKMAPNSRA